MPNQGVEPGEGRPAVRLAATLCTAASRPWPWYHLGATGSSLRGLPPARSAAKTGTMKWIVGRLFRLSMTHRLLGVALSILSACAHSAEDGRSAPNDQSNPPLESWLVLPPESINWREVGYSSASWYVWREGGRVVAGSKPVPVSSSLPFVLDPVAGNDGMDLRGARIVRAVENGYLVGFDAGEFGGALWWFSPDGGSRKRVTPRVSASEPDYFPENVKELIGNGAHFLAFQGLTHLGGNAGRVIRVDRNENGEWEASLFATLPGCPQSVVAESSSSWLVATTRGVLRIDSGGMVTWLWQPSGGHLSYPNSLARDDSGRTFMGMRELVVRLTPRNSGGYSAQVLLPPAPYTTRAEVLSATPTEPTELHLPWEDMTLDERCDLAMLALSVQISPEGKGTSMMDQVCVAERASIHGRRAVVVLATAGRI